MRKIMKKDELPVIAIDADGELVLWVNGNIKASKQIKGNILLASELKLPTLINDYKVVDANLENNSDLLAVFAAMMNGVKGRSRLLKAPQELYELISRSEDV
jgi:hypothetical protein